MPPVEPNSQNVRKFGKYTCDLYAISKYLKENKISTVAMESTGVYWIPLFQRLISDGFEVFLVNPRDLKNIPGRTKTDKHDAGWLQKLHSYGLLKASFQPSKEIREIRSLSRNRSNLVRDNSSNIQLMQKALNTMNILLPRVVSDITGKTGINIIKAIISGEQDPVKLAKLKNPKIKASDKELIKALTGDYSAVHIFELKQAYKSYRFYEEQIKEYDLEIAKYIKKIVNKTKSIKKQETSKLNSFLKQIKDNNEEQKMKEYFHSILKVDLTKIPGMGIQSVRDIISEIGYDMSKWPSAKHFASWLGFPPNIEISGGKILKNKTRKVASKAAQIIRMAAYSTMNTKTYLGNFFRRLRTRMNAGKAITAVANKLSVIIYNMIAKQQEYIEYGDNYYDAKIKDKEINKLRKRAKKLGLELVPIS